MHPAVLCSVISALFFFYYYFFYYLYLYQFMHYFMLFLLFLLNYFFNSLQRLGGWVLAARLLLISNREFGLAGLGWLGFPGWVDTSLEPTPPPPAFPTQLWVGRGSAAAAARGGAVRGRRGGRQCPHRRRGPLALAMHTECAAPLHPAAAVRLRQGPAGGVRC